jgi:hypothetical protein
MVKLGSHVDTDPNRVRPPGSQRKCGLAGEIFRDMLHPSPGSHVDSEHLIHAPAVMTTSFLYIIGFKQLIVLEQNLILSPIPNHGSHQCKHELTEEILCWINADTALLFLRP